MFDLPNTLVSRYVALCARPHARTYIDAVNGFGTKNSKASGALMAQVIDAALLDGYS